MCVEAKAGDFSYVEKPAEFSFYVATLAANVPLLLNALLHACA